MPKIRLDQRVFELGLAESREKAKALIMAGAITADGQKEYKPGAPVTEQTAVALAGEKLRYVSRGGLKLQKAMSEFPINL